MSAALARRGTMRAAARKLTPATLALAEALKGTKRGRFPVSPVADRTVDGIVFDSKREAKRYGELAILERAGVISDLQVQVGLRVSIADQHYCTFTVDFGYLDVATKVYIYEEIKSSGTRKDAAYRLRRKAAELYHGIKIKETVA